MKTLTATQARKEIYHLVEEVDMNHQPIQITSKRANAVLISEADWNNIQETLYLLSIPNMRESIKKGLETPLDNCQKDIDTDIDW